MHFRAFRHDLISPSVKACPQTVCLFSKAVKQVVQSWQWFRDGGKCLEFQFTGAFLLSAFSWIQHFVRFSRLSLYHLADQPDNCLPAVSSQWQTCFGMQPAGIRMTLSIQQNCTRSNNVSMPSIPQVHNTPANVTLSCCLMPAQTVPMKLINLTKKCQYVITYSKPYNSVDSTTA